MQFVLDCVTTILTALLCFFMLFRKYEIRKEHLLIRSILAAGSVLLKICIVFLQIPMLNFISSLVMSIIIINIIYKCRFRTTLIYSFVFLMIALAADVLGVLIVSAFYQHTITETLGTTDLVWHHHLWNWIAQIFLSRIAAAIIQKNDNIKVKWHEILFYIFLLLFEIIFFATVSSAIQDYMSGQFLIFIMLGFVVLDICIMYIFHKISLAREAEQKVYLMQQQEKLQLQMYQELREKYSTTCEIAHDMNRHISSLKALIANHPVEQAEYYLSDLVKETERLRPSIKNQNAMLEIIINTISDRCEKENILLEMNIEDFPITFISDIDITTIFSNLFDNAIDACMEISKSQRKVHFVLKKQMGLIVFRMTNSCKDMTNQPFQYYRSTKPSQSGIGLSNVKKAVEKYDGIMNINQEKNKFCVSITFNDNT